MRNTATGLSTLLQLSLDVKILFANRLPDYNHLVSEENLFWGIL
jgi:hypothetical protein